MMPKIASVKSSSGRQVAMVPYSALSVGSLTFFDRTYKFKDIGDYSANCLFMKISNNDKNTAASKTQYTISLSESSVIYLDFWGGEQHAKKGFSTWSSGWKLSSKPSTSFDSWGPGVVYQKEFDAGDVILKGNDGNNHGSYYAFICPASERAGCWSGKLEGKYIKEQHGATNECYDFEEAKRKCEEASDCHGIATQSNVCSGKYRVTHGSTATLLTYGNWRAYNLWAYTFDRTCRSALVQGKLLYDTNAEKPMAYFDDGYKLSGSNVILRKCSNCPASHATIYYKRITHTDKFKPYKCLVDTWRTNCDGVSNVLNKDFELYSTLDDLMAGRKRWTYCNYNDPGVGFPRDCGPTGYVPYTWNALSSSKHRRNGRIVKFYAMEKAPAAPAPTPVPTPAPSPEPTPAPSPEPTPAPSPE